MSNKVSDEMLDRLRASLESEMSPHRFRHTCGVERMAQRIGAIYCPEKTSLLRAAALLHDITKEYKTEEHIRICRELGGEYLDEDLQSPKTFHGKTAALLIPSRYPELADSEIIGAVRYHTTGRADMTLCEKIIYLADYIDDTRTFDDCIRLRSLFWDACPERMNAEERMMHLDGVLLESFDVTVRALLDEGQVINPETVAARNFLIVEIKKRKDK